MKWDLRSRPHISFFNIDLTKDKDSTHKDTLAAITQLRTQWLSDCSQRCLGAAVGLGEVRIPPNECSCLHPCLICQDKCHLMKRSLLLFKKKFENHSIQISAEQRTVGCQVRGLQAPTWLLSSVQPPPVLPPVHSHQ